MKEHGAEPFERTEKIKKENRNALYLQIYDDICAKIEAKILNAGDKLPTEQRLCEIYDVSRVTVRKALDFLIKEGIIYREYSKCAVIAAKKTQRDFAKLESLRNAIIKAGKIPTSVITGSQCIPASGTIAGILKIPEGEPLVAFHRLRLSNGSPVAVQDVYIRRAFCSLSDIRNLGNRSLFDTLETKYDLTIDYADQVLSAKMPTKKQRQELELQSEEPVLFVKRTTYLSNGEALEYAESYYIPNCFELSVRSYRDTEDSSQTQ